MPTKRKQTARSKVVPPTGNSVLSADTVLEFDPECPDMSGNDRKTRFLT